MNILAIGAHPDDIEFGCGGSLCRLGSKRHDLHFLILTNGSMGGTSGIRRKEQMASAKLLGVKNIFWGNFKDTEVCLNRKLINIIEETIRKVKPDMLFLNYFNDSHQDHRALAEAAISASRYVKKVFFYEVPTTQGFEPDVFVDISNCLSQKLKLLKMHVSQVHKTRVPKLTILESADACAKFRGFQARVKYAEGFKSLRMLLDI